MHRNREILHAVITVRWANRNTPSAMVLLIFRLSAEQAGYGETEESLAFLQMPVKELLLFWGGRK